MVREEYTLEFKRTVDPANRAELAKDVATLANMYGGSILIGAVETAAGVDYPGLPAAHAKLVQEGYTFAVRDFCSPHPIFAVREILNPDDNDRVVVAVSVEPFPDQPVGAAAADKERRPTDAWRFPIRVRSHATFASPDQLMLWFNPQTRRAAIGLSQIPEGTRVAYFCEGARGSGVHAGEANLTKWSITENFVELNPMSVMQLVVVPFRAPLEDVASVSKTVYGVWQIRLRGSVQQIAGQPGVVSFGYHPGS